MRRMLDADEVNRVITEYRDRETSLCDASNLEEARKHLERAYGANDALFYVSKIKEEEAYTSEEIEVKSMEKDFTDNEKAFLEMLFKIGKEMMDLQDGYIEIHGSYFTRNNLFELSEKLGVEYY